MYIIMVLLFTARFNQAVTHTPHALSPLSLFSSLLSPLSSLLSPLSSLLSPLSSLLSPLSPHPPFPQSFFSSLPHFFFHFFFVGFLATGNWSTHSIDSGNPVPILEHAL